MLCQWHPSEACSLIEIARNMLNPTYYEDTVSCPEHSSTAVAIDHFNEATEEVREPNSNQPPANVEEEPKTLEVPKTDERTPTKNKKKPRNNGRGRGRGRGRGYGPVYDGRFHQYGPQWYNRDY